jgi:hypothetical protein
MNPQTKTERWDWKRLLIFFSLHYLLGLLLLISIVFLFILMKTYLHWLFAFPLVLVVIAFRLKLFEALENLPDSKLKWLAERWNWPLSFFSEFLILFTLSFGYMSLAVGIDLSRFLVISVAVIILYSLLVTLPIIWCHQAISRASKQFGLQETEVFRWKLICRLAWLYGFYQFNRSVLHKAKENSENITNSQSF